MASLCLNLLPSPHSRRLTEASSASSSSPPPSPSCSATPKSSNSNSISSIGSLKPIVVKGNPPTFVSAPGRRIVAVGDLHGDLEKARRAFQMAGVLSSDGQDIWTGKETVLVQLGDILDRGDDEIAILSLLRSMDKQAQEEGGAVFQINGNHETMNVEGDFRYVETGAFEECAGFLDYLVSYGYEWEEAFPCWVAESEKWRQDQKTSQNYWDSWNLVKRQKGVIARSVLLRPGGPLACELARHAVVLRVNDWVFCHGGLLPHHVAYGIERMNFQVSNWMRGLSESDLGPQLPFIATRGYDSVVWSRLYSRDVSDLDDYQISQIQSILEETLQAVDAKAMVVGHTPQTAGVNCKYNRSIWRIDVGMSSGVLNSRPEVLEIVDGKARAIKGRRDMLSELHVVDYT
ncbi:shewanella-like protein phosphatase 1 [Syzygium oleosum]|uniref:shewanella-like protein phosphatase 1 n=1 Tax=Syzygium oleosum TaxID=219896 RepID=UPI0011D2C196|nr:shewanella-like protein phosphatase 1 [Syzygium oleosum]XP_030464414.1 shewanella-like protein phosphatase 1 [Syzygium oleosum]